MRRARPQSSTAAAGQQLTVVVLSPGAPPAGDYEAALESLGHAVVVKEAASQEPSVAVADERPDVVLVAVSEDVEEALSTIDEIVARSASPVVAVGTPAAPAIADAIAAHGVFGYAGAADPDQLLAAIEVARHRFAEYRKLQAAFDHRATVEQAKGILMERHAIGERAAFEMLRAQARRTNRKLVDVAAAVTDGHPLLPASPPDDRRSVREQ